MLLVQCKLDFAFIALYVVVCNSETCDTGPERPGKVTERVKEAIVDDLVEEGEGNVENKCRRIFSGVRMEPSWEREDMWNDSDHKRKRMCSAYEVASSLDP
jgi:hypothetical protein